MASFRIDISAPNIVNVCIDRVTETEKAGRMYSCYEKEAYFFSNELQLLKKMEDLMNRLNYPQNSMNSRTYSRENVQHREERPEKVQETEEIFRERGEAGTFMIHVQYRQNATWQGRVVHVETDEVIGFRSALELLKILDCEI